MESDGLSAIGAVSASWCDVSNPFVAPRPFADVRAAGPLADLGDIEEPVCVSDGADPALDSCASIFAIETAELAMACTDELAASTREVLCGGRRASLRCGCSCSGWAAAM